MDDDKRRGGGGGEGGEERIGKNTNTGQSPWAHLPTLAWVRCVWACKRISILLLKKRHGFISRIQPNPQQGSDWQPSVSDGQLWSIIGALGDSDGSTPPSPSQGPSVSTDPVLIEVRVARPQKTLGAKA
ncbi:hypothetical protein GX48_07797 [Paracoccidioides brasiliensis]|nr:hypothetical protein GX48_07797 [Paracoccidioides brasiliensis]